MTITLNDFLNNATTPEHLSDLGEEAASFQQRHLELLNNPDYTIVFNRYAQARKPFDEKAKQALEKVPTQGLVGGFASIVFVLPFKIAPHLPSVTYHRAQVRKFYADFKPF